MENKESYFFSDTAKLNRALVVYCGDWENCNPLQISNPEMQYHYLFCYITKGKGKLQINNKKCVCHEIGENTIFLIRPGMNATYLADENKLCEYCWFCIDGYEVENILQDCGFSKDNILFFDKSKGIIREALLKFIFSYKSNSDNEYMLLSLLYNFFAQIKQQYKNENAKSIYVEQAIDYIYKNYDKNIAIGDMANYLNVDRTYLYRLFKKECGLSPQKYLLNFRLKVAMSKLENTQNSIREISEACGFNQVSLFCYQFKKFYKDTPLNYRKIFRCAI